MQGGSAGYHKVSRIEITAAGASVQVLSWPSLDAKQAIGETPIWSSVHALPEGFASGGISIASVETWCAGPTGPLAGGTLLDDERPSLEAMRARQWAAIKAERSRLEYGGFTWDGSTFDSDPDARARIMGAVIEAQALGPDFSRTWRLADNSLRQLDAEQMLAVGIALGAHVGRVFDIGNALYQQIQASDDPESITWPASVETQLPKA